MASSKLRRLGGRALVSFFATAMVLLVPGATALCRKPMQGSTMADPPIVIWGAETMIGFGSGFREVHGAKPGVEGPWLAPLVTALMLTLLSGWIYRNRPTKPSILYTLITFYPFATAIVELIRVNFDSSRFGFLTAAWHNLPEYGMLLYMFQSRKNADKYFPLLLLWEWILHMWILFVPSLNGVMRGVFFAGFAEQITGICCDFLLMTVFTYMYFSVRKEVQDNDKGGANVTSSTTASSPYSIEAKKSLKTAYLYAMLGAYCHMLEIGPLVVMLSGIATRPYLPVSLIVALTSPITMYLYGKFIYEFTCGAAAPLSETKDALKGNTIRKLLAVGIITGLSFILSPALVPYCPGTAPVKPGSMNITTAVTPTSICPASPASLIPDYPVTEAPAMCISKSKLTGTTTVWPKPGKEQAVMDLIATMPGPIRLENGSLWFDVAHGLDHEGRFVVKVFESWSSITSLYRHIYMSPTVNRVFRSPEFAALVEKQLLEGPFEAAIPCTEVQSEALPVTIPFSTIIEAPVGCLWARFDNWCGDSSWVSHSKGVECARHNSPLRTLHFSSLDMPVLRQAAPLSPPEQPEDGHRLIYYPLNGGFIGALGESYRGDLTIVPVPEDPSKTLLTYKATIVAKDVTKTQVMYDQIFNDFNNHRIPFLREWGRNASRDCHS